MLRLALAEILGTFIIVFFGTASMVVNDTTGGGLGHAGVCFAWGAAVSFAIVFAERIGQGHFNPAVTITDAIKEKLPVSKIIVHILSQCIGAIIASVLLSIFSPANSLLGATLPKLDLVWVFLIEVLISFGLMGVILFTVRKQYSLVSAALLIGGYVVLAAFFAGPYTGASMNPARTLGPAIISGQMAGFWVYMIAPTLGMLAAIPTFHILRKPNLS
jgi:aquaporin Z